MADVPYRYERTATAAELAAAHADLDETARDIRNRLFRAEFKRRQEPPALYVSRVPFGEAWSVPVAGRYRMPS